MFTPCGFSPTTAIMIGLIFQDIDFDFLVLFFNEISTASEYKQQDREGLFTYHRIFIHVKNCEKPRVNNRKKKSVDSSDLVAKKKKKTH